MQERIKSRTLSGAALALFIASGMQAGCAVAGQHHDHDFHEGGVTHTATSELLWTKTPFGPDAAVVEGDFSRGAHITYIRFPAGMQTPIHTHSADYVGVVISGTTRHWLPGRAETRKLLPVGSHWSIPAEVEHVSECLPGAECIMAIYQRAAFDFLPVDRAADASLDDAEIVAIYNQVNSFDIDTGYLGLRKAESPEVRKLAAMVVRDHAAVREKAAALAAYLGLEPALPVGRQAAAEEHARAIRELSALSGTEFERAYLNHEIAFHTAAIDAVKTVLLPAVKDPQLKKLIKDVLPGFEHHLEQTRKVAGMPGY